VSWESVLKSVLCRKEMILILRDRWMEELPVVIHSYRYLQRLIQLDAIRDLASPGASVCDPFGLCIVAACKKAGNTHNSDSETIETYTIRRHGIHCNVQNEFYNLLVKRRDSLGGRQNCK
jgi:hypothetical protein